MDTKILTDNNIDVNKSLELFGDMATYNSMLAEFLNEIDSKLENAKKYKDSTDLLNYAIVVHGLKSDCKYFGMMDLADMYYKHEMAGKSGDFAFISSDFDNLMNETARMVNVLKSYLNKEQSTAPNISQVNDTAASSSILVVDDSNIVRNFIEKIFAGKYDIKMASDGEQAIKIVTGSDRDKIVCMFLDLNMPNVNGFEVLDYFKENDLFDKIPVSIITGLNDKSIINRAFTYPIVDMLQKPFSEDTVKNAVIRTIARRKK